MKAMQAQRLQSGRTLVRTLARRQPQLAKRSSRCLAVGVLAFKDSPVGFRDQAAVSVRGINHYDLLHLSDAHELSPYNVQAAFESMVQAPTQAAYSQDTLFSRAVLLKSAAECLTDPNSRQALNTRLRAGLNEMKVAQTDIPGALVLLQESGAYEVAIQLGTSWLKANEDDNASAPDVATCTALALCDRAAATLVSQSAGSPEPAPHGQDGVRGSVLLSACEDLDHALRLCKEHDVAHALQEQCKDALEGYAAPRAVELVSLPLGAKHDTQRTQGIELIKQTLHRPLPEPPKERVQHMSKVEDMLTRARIGLTASEQILLYSDLRRSAAVCASSTLSASVEYDTAMAYLAEGFAKGWSHYVYCADQLFAKAERAAGDAGPGNAKARPAQSRVALERACCVLLLGQDASAREFLGLTPNSLFRPDADVETFVLENSPSRDDLYPGLIVLTQGWLAEAVLSGFREWSQRPTKLSSAVQALPCWHDKPAVSAYNKVYSVCKSLSFILGFVHMLLRIPEMLQAKLQGKATGDLSPVETTVATRQPAANARAAARGAAAARSPGVEEGGRAQTDDLPDHPLIPIQDVVIQADTLTVNQLMAKLPSGLLPQRAKVSALIRGGEVQESDPTVISERALRQQLDRMEKEMWDGAPIDPSASGSGSWVTTLCCVVALAALVVAVLATTNRLPAEVLNMPTVGPALATLGSMARGAATEGRLTRARFVDA